MTLVDIAMDKLRYCRCFWTCKALSW